MKPLALEIATLLSQGNATPGFPQLETKPHFSREAAFRQRWPTKKP